MVDEEFSVMLELSFIHVRLWGLKGEGGGEGRSYWDLMLFVHKLEIQVYW